VSDLGALKRLDVVYNAPTDTQEGDEAGDTNHNDRIYIMKCKIITY
jgi:hypothetical protein